DQFVNNRSIVTEAFHGKRDRCDVTPLYTQPWEQKLADCLAAINSPAGCAANLQQEIISHITLPSVPSPPSPPDEVTQAIQGVVGTVTGKAPDPCSVTLPTGTTACVATSELVDKVKQLQPAICASI